MNETYDTSFIYSQKEKGFTTHRQDDIRNSYFIAEKRFIRMYVTVRMYFI